jgi:hypothetical protein
MLAGQPSSWSPAGPSRSSPVSSVTWASSTQHLQCAQPGRRRRPPRGARGPRHGDRPRSARLAIRPGPFAYQSRLSAVLFADLPDGLLADLLAGRRGTGACALDECPSGGGYPPPRVPSPLAGGCSSVMRSIEPDSSIWGMYPPLWALHDEAMRARRTAASDRPGCPAGPRTGSARGPAPGAGSDGGR